MISKEQLLAELNALQQQKITFQKQEAEAADRVKRTEGAIEMTLIFIKRLQAEENKKADVIPDTKKPDSKAPPIDVTPDDDDEDDTVDEEIARVN